MATLTIEFFSKSLLRNVTVKAVLPVDKIDFQGGTIQPKVPFKTLYLLHGIYGNESGWLTESRICRWAAERDLAVIMPNGENHFYTDCDDSGEKYGEFIGEELVEITRKMFPLSDKKEDTFIAGLSMGGYGAIHNGLKYNETFGYVAGLSTAFLVDEEILYSDDSDPMFTFRRTFYRHVFGKLEKAVGSERDPYAQIKSLIENDIKIPNMYLCIGYDDPFYENNIAFRDFLVEQNVEVTFEEGPGGHDWDFWDEYIKRILEWLPLGEISKGVGDGNVM